MLSAPLKPVLGVYVSVPSALIATAPLAADAVVMVKLSPSISLSFAKTLMVTALSSVVVAVSATATGASFSGFTVTATVEVAVPPLPSLTS